MKTKVTKTQWTAMFEEVGLTEETMHQWHRIFEQKHPQAHQSFLQWLQIDADEIQLNREKSAK